MRKARPEEREEYYREEWSVDDVPDYILHNLSLREFGFDLDGTGPSDRYNQFMTSEDLAEYLRDNHPFAVYGSVALYERPSERKKWLKSELAFDIDAKDLPFKRCDCTGGNVCELCLDDARKTALEFGETLESDLGLDSVSYVYSGRGFHIRVFDESIMGMGQAARSQIVEYVTGSIIPSDFSLALGYSRVFRKRALRTFKELNEEVLKERSLSRRMAKKLMNKKENVLKKMENGDFEGIKDFEGIGPKSFKKLMQLITRLNSEYTDGKVTIDKKRILRIPSSLHSTVSRKCVEVPDMRNFSFDAAVPEFLRG
ncbi:MAG: DNA primase catalytic subunit PriS [Candidatus Hadarchaeia archaeon]